MTNWTKGPFWIIEELNVNKINTVNKNQDKYLTCIRQQTASKNWKFISLSLMLIPNQS